LKARALDQAGEAEGVVLIEAGDALHPKVLDQILAQWQRGRAPCPEALGADWRSTFKKSYYCLVVLSAFESFGGYHRVRREKKKQTVQ